MIAERARALFAAAFGRAPAVIASAPGRVNLIGEHLDYNGGEVLPIAIDLRLQVAMHHGTGNETRIVSADLSGCGAVSLAEVKRSGAWYDYVTGPLALLRETGVRVPGLDVAVAGDLPIAAGLASSSALEVATLTAAVSLLGVEMTPETLAFLARRAEAEFVGVPCGIMDQFASALGRLGHALHIHCDKERVEHVPFADPVLIFDTSVARNLRDSSFAERQAECAAALAAIRSVAPEVTRLAHATFAQLEEAALWGPAAQRARHVIGEAERVREAVRSLRQTGRIPGELLYRSHESLRDDYDCSSPELDWFVALAASHSGIDGARLTGAGWGGCAIALGERRALELLADEAPRRFRDRFARESRCILTRAAGGARLEAGELA